MGVDLEETTERLYVDVTEQLNASRVQQSQEALVGGAKLLIGRDYFMCHNSTVKLDGRSIYAQATKSIYGIADIIRKIQRCNK